MYRTVQLHPPCYIVLTAGYDLSRLAGPLQRSFVYVHFLLLQRLSQSFYCKLCTYIATMHLGGYKIFMSSAIDSNWKSVV